MYCRGGTISSIAIIEDDPAMVSWLSAAIEGAEDLCISAVATTARDGAALIDKGGYDVLLCDLGLPDGSGIDLIRQSVRQHPDADVMVVTLFDDQRNVVNAIRAGARGYLLKGMEADACTGSIREMLRGGSPINPRIARMLLQQIRPDAIDGDAQLTERERDVLNVLARGFSKAECAGLLGISVNTVGTYVKRIYSKLEVNSRTAAIYEASAQGMID
ncbi:response regulator transcription factor [Sphingomonas sp. SUN039]|uniref:response regulator n=1 Tax=Sphingomonas sp. SUN039 TaxID=2937787 RepID=UPI002164BF23|nr:response regulator transcription factor [Sphingomonas sp. SUN039]UVO54732.1 response regulator transcription factor [Sphingomonas sp. SUN039]